MPKATQIYNGVVIHLTSVKNDTEKNPKILLISGKNNIEGVDEILLISAKSNTERALEILLIYAINNTEKNPEILLISAKTNTGKDPQDSFNFCQKQHRRSPSIPFTSAKGHPRFFYLLSKTT